MKRFAAVAVGLLATFALSVGAANASPTATAEVILKPQGPVYKDVARPVNATFNGTITPGPGDVTLDALMESKFKVPQGLKFVSDPKMPTCSFTEAEANVPTDTALAKCPDALIGNGTSTLYVNQLVKGKITDPRILIFNGGNGKLVMQGYSTSTNAGITFGGEIKNGILDVKIPRLTFDSSNPQFSLSIPGEAIPAVVGPPPASAVPAGLDPDFVQAPCATGKWTASATFYLGDRSEAGAVSNTSQLTTDPVSKPCTAAKGKVKFSGVKVKGPAKVKSGKKGTFKVTVKNTGTANASKVKVKASGAGKGSGSGGTIKAGTSKTIKVKAKVTGKKGKKVTVKFKVSGGASATAKAKVKVG